MRFFKILLILLLSIIAIIAVITLFLPSKFEISRSIEINKPAYTAFDLVNNLQSHQKWSPWLALDQNMNLEYEGPVSGVDAAYIWNSGNSDLGSGRMQCIKSEPFILIEHNLEFEKQKGALSLFRFDEYDGKTKITWTVEGELALLYRWMGPFMDGKVGEMLDEGLSELKIIAEGEQEINLEIAPDDFEGMRLAVIRDSASHDDMQAIGQALGAAYTEIMNFFSINMISPEGPPVAINIQWQDKYVFEAGIPVSADLKVLPTGRIKWIDIPPTIIIKGVYKGPYHNIGAAYSAMHSFLIDKELIENGYTWEEYISDPSLTPPDSIITNIYFPVK